MKIAVTALSEPLKYVEARKPLKGGETHQSMNKMSDEARCMTSELDDLYRDPEGIRGLLPRLFNKSVDLSFHVFPPSCMDSGKNIMVGKNVFINAYCHLQDHGGVMLGDGRQIGHNVVSAILNHGFTPEDRGITYPASIVLKKNVRIDSNVIILSGVTIGENVVVGTGSIITRDVPDNAIMGGAPAKVIKYTQ